jgi:predicted DNA binding CopG/RHH family protein
MLQGTVLFWNPRIAIPYAELPNPPSGGFLTHLAGHRAMLQGMQQPAAPAPSPNSASFAGLLASLTAPAHKQAAVWSDEDLADDFATISYESALRAHGRPRVTEPADHAPVQTATSAARIRDASQGVVSPAPQEEIPPQALATFAAGSGTTQHESNALDRNLKCFSITIRLSKTECEQLRKRAAEAGLTVSAYLRSCTFEAEALRAQVKETLAELRSAGPRGEQSSSPQPKRSWSQSWPRGIMRIFPPWHASQRSAPA